MRSEEDPELIIDGSTSAADLHLAAASFRMFMRLPVARRGSVILMDVLGYSLREISEILGLTLPAVKAALHPGGRIRIRKLAHGPDDDVSSS